MVYDQRIERKIVIGMIVSQDYLQQLRPFWSSRLIKSAAAKRLARWCVEYYDQHRKAPGKNIETIFLAKLRQDKLPEDVAEEIEQDILPDLSEEYDPEQFNVEYLLSQTKEYFRVRHLEEHQHELQVLLEQGELLGAERLANEYKPLADNVGHDLDLSTDAVLAKIESAFTLESQAVVSFPRALGEIWNDQMIRGGFVALMASEKRGKSFWLLELATRASRQGAKVAFFQAGDMTEGQQLRRMCVHLTGQPLKDLTEKKKFVPVRDCIFNQDDSCDRPEREHDEGIFTEKEMKSMERGIRKTIQMPVLLEKFKKFPEHQPCYNCGDYHHNPWGTPWLKPIDVSEITYKDGQRAVEKFFIRKKRRFKLSTHANGTLSVKEIYSLLDLWERQDDFVPDMIVIDYADLLAAETREFRHAQNEIWKGLRGLSQAKHCLVITATQADAKSYEQERLKLSNFSEDKRKYAHVTAIYGLNQDPQGREKELGIMRINELVVREAEFSSTREVTVLQSLNTGQPCLTSFW